MMNNSPTPRLEVRDLACQRGNRRLFTGLSFDLGPGQVLQIEGANGSGKTTLLRTICGLLQADTGTIRWGQEIILDVQAEYHAQLTYLGHLPGVKLDLTPLENLRISQALHGGVHDNPSLLRALDEIGLYGFEQTPCRQLSAGQRRRVALARLCLARTALWVLDEPYTALDRAGTEMLSQRLALHLQAGGMAILTSHQPVVISTITISRLVLE